MIQAKIKIKNQITNQQKKYLRELTSNWIQAYNINSWQIFSNSSHSALKLTKMSVIHTTKSDEFQELISTGVALVDFSASWCGPCKRVEPVFKELAKENPTVKFIHIDVDEASDSMPNELADVSGVPHFELFHNGTKISQFAGANLNKIRESVKLLKTKLEPPKEEAAKEEPPKEEAAKEEPPKEEAPKKEPVKEESSDQESKTNENKTESTSEEQNAQQKSE